MNERTSANNLRKKLKLCKKNYARLKSEQNIQIKNVRYKIKSQVKEEYNKIIKVLTKSSKF